MTLLVRASELNQRPVVTLGGEDVAEIKDVVYGGSGGEIIGFTLNKRGGFFRGRLAEILLWPEVHGLGRDAVMVADDSALQAKDELVAAARDSGGGGGDVLGARVLTEEGVAVGEVIEVIIDVRPDKADVVGYEVEASENLRSQQQRVLVPLPDTLAVSGENLIVPSSVTQFIRDDIAGFGAAVDDFRSQLRGGSS